MERENAKEETTGEKEERGGGRGWKTGEVRLWKTRRRTTKLLMDRGGGEELSSVYV